MNVPSDSLLIQIGELRERYQKLKEDASFKMKNRLYSSCEEMRRDASLAAKIHREWKALADSYRQKTASS